LHKFGWFPDGVNDEPYVHPNSWAKEKTSGPDRLVIAPRSNQVELILKLASRLAEQLLLLYVLVVPREGSTPGRNQSEPISLEKLDSFLRQYLSFFEGDARHNIWIRSSDNGMLVFDRHNVIYAYGPLDKFTSTLVASGLTEIENIRFPAPHTHHYQAEFDDSERLILEEQSWIRSPLCQGDENPD
jgi:hypothetical protein